jgi:predicted O-methyltransferase YrrM
MCKFGRRLGWYAVARAIKPKTIVETGVDKGLGSCVLSAALARNTEEGYPGHYYGFDINPKAGYLLAGKYAEFGEIRYGDSLASLRQLDAAIDLFINDSDYNPNYETAEYNTVAPRLSPNAIVLGDNSHATDRLLAFSLATERQFAFFRETPDKHWYPGAGIGISFKRKRRSANEG